MTTQLANLDPNDKTALRDALAQFDGPELARCALLLRLGNLDEAHRIAQEDASELGSYWHGIMHRAEGDLPNARYWFHRAGNLPARLGLDPNGIESNQAALDEEWTALLRYTLSSSDREGLRHG